VPYGTKYAAKEQYTLQKRWRELNQGKVNFLFASYRRTERKFETGISHSKASAKICQKYHCYRSYRRYFDDF
jgi:hypothetical protein